MQEHAVVDQPVVASHQLRIEAGELGDPRAAPGDGRRIALAARQVGQVLGRGVAFDIRKLARVTVPFTARAAAPSGQLVTQASGSNL